VSELILVSSGVGGASGGVGEARDAELDGLGAVGADLLLLGEFGVRAGEADLEALSLAVPGVGFGFGDAGDEVVADRFQPCAGGRVRVQQRTA
jgi:hypothetical protein